MVFETHRLHPVFQECKVSANFCFSLHRHIYIKRKEEVHGDRLDKMTK